MFVIYSSIFIILLNLINILSSFVFHSCQLSSHLSIFFFVTYLLFSLRLLHRILFSTQDQTFLTTNRHATDRNSLSDICWYAVDFGRKVMYLEYLFVVSDTYYETYIP